MKKLTSLMAVLMLLFTLTACSSTNLTNTKMYIQEAELTKEEESILNLVGSEVTPYILDFVIDDTVQALQINTYELEKNEWKLIAGGGGRQLNVTKSRIALSFDNIGLGLHTAVQNQGSNSYKSDLKFDFEGFSTTTAFLSDKAIIEYEKEIPLVIQIHTTKNEIASLSPEYGFYEPETYADFGYEKVYAITCLFSQKSVNELSSLSK